MVDGGSGCADAAFTVDAAIMPRPVARNVRRPVSVGMNTVPRLASLFDDPDWRERPGSLVSTEYGLKHAEFTDQYILRFQSLQFQPPVTDQMHHIGWGGNSEETA